MDLDQDPKRSARLAGALYLLIILSGITGGVLRSQLAPESLGFRLSILADVAMALADVGVGVLLYFLLLPVSRVLSMLAMAFRLAQAAGIGLNLLNLVLAAELAQRGDPLAATFFTAHGIGYDLSLFFFAINCFLTGALVYRAPFMPRSLGAMIGAAGLVYLVGSSLRVVAPALAELIAPAYGLTLIAELSLCLYLLTRGLEFGKWQGAA